MANPTERFPRFRIRLRMGRRANDMCRSYQGRVMGPLSETRRYFGQNTFARCRRMHPWALRALGQAELTRAYSRPDDPGLQNIRVKKRPPEQKENNKKRQPWPECPDRRLIPIIADQEPVPSSLVAHFFGPNRLMRSVDIRTIAAVSAFPAGSRPAVTPGRPVRLSDPPEDGYGACPRVGSPPRPGCH